MILIRKVSSNLSYTSQLIYNLKIKHDTLKFMPVLSSKMGHSELENFRLSLQNIKSYIPSPIKESDLRTSCDIGCFVKYRRTEDKRKLFRD